LKREKSKGGKKGRGKERGEVASWLLGMDAPKGLVSII